MIVRLDRRAIRQLDAIVNRIAVDRPLAARALIQRIERRLQLIADTGFVDMARAGRIAGSRELTEPPFVLTYIVDAARDELVVLSVVHGARRR